MTASATVERTGEIVEFPDDTPEEVLESYRLLNDYLNAYEAVKKKLQKAAADIVDERGVFEHDGYLLRVYSTQRSNYDKAVLRNVFDADLFDTFMEPAKGRIDHYIRDHLAELGEQSTELRKSMVPAGRPYTTVRLEKLEAPR